MAFGMKPPMTGAPTAPRPFAPASAPKPMAPRPPAAKPVASPIAAPLASPLADNDRDDFRGMSRPKSNRRTGGKRVYGRSSSGRY